MKNFKKLMVFGALALIAVPVFSAEAGLSGAGRPVDAEGRALDQLSSKHSVGFAKISPQHAQEVLNSPLYVRFLHSDEKALVDQLASARDQAAHSAILTEQDARVSAAYDRVIAARQAPMSEERYLELNEHRGLPMLAGEYSEFCRYHERVKEAQAVIYEAD